MLNLEPEDELSFNVRIEELTKLGMKRGEAAQKVLHERILLNKRLEEEVDYFSFYPGDLVMMQVMNAKKFEANYEGPYAVTRKGPCGTYKLLHPDGKEKPDMVNVQRLKIAHLNDDQFQEIFSSKAKDMLLKAVQEFEKSEEVILRERGMLGLIQVVIQTTLSIESRRRDESRDADDSSRIP